MLCCNHTSSPRSHHQYPFLLLLLLLRLRLRILLLLVLLLLLPPLALHLLAHIESGLRCVSFQEWSAVSGHVQAIDGEGRGLWKRGEESARTHSSHLLAFNMYYHLCARATLLGTGPRACERHATVVMMVCSGLVSIHSPTERIISQIGAKARLSALGPMKLVNYLRTVHVDVP